MPDISGLGWMVPAIVPLDASALAPLLALPSGWEWVILAIVALLLFGGPRLAGIGKSAGRAIREFKEETGTGDKKNASAKASASSDDAGEIVDAQIVEDKTSDA